MAIRAEQAVLLPEHPVSLRLVQVKTLLFDLLPLLFESLLFEIYLSLERVYHQLASVKMINLSLYL